MRSIKSRSSLLRVVLITGVAMLAIPIAARVSPTSSTFVTEQQSKSFALIREVPFALAKNKVPKITPPKSLSRPQDYYDRRREYWEDRMERRMEHMEEEESGDDNSADEEDSKASDDDSEESMDSEEELIERRREYWSDRLDRDW
jgi:hypothetical protein